MHRLSIKLRSLRTDQDLRKQIIHKNVLPYELVLTGGGLVMLYLHEGQFERNLEYQRDTLKARTNQKLFFLIHSLNLKNLVRLSLHLGKNCFTVSLVSECLQKVSECLQKLSPGLVQLALHLELATDVILADIWKTLRRFRMLQSLDLKVTHSGYVTKGGLEKMKSALASLLHLSAIQIWLDVKCLGSKLGSDLGMALTHMRKLKYFSFDMPYNSEEPCEQLELLFGKRSRNLKSLERLEIFFRQEENLKAPDFEHKFCQNLKFLSQLRCLRLLLGGPFLEMRGVAELTNSIQHMEQLTFLNLKIIHQTDIDGNGLEKEFIKLLIRLKKLNRFELAIFCCEFNYNFDALLLVIKEKTNIKTARLESSTPNSSRWYDRFQQQSRDIPYSYCQMPRELITVQVGQCGNQMGLQFWDLALKEHCLYNKDSIYDDALSSFFRNIDSRNNQDLPYNNGKNKVHNLKARTVIVDMEENVISQIMKSDIKDLFNQKQTIQDVSGAGNNWACGFGVYGPQYEEEIIDKLRKEAESCDSLQCFLMLHSTGGGTGSGVGSYILNILNDNFEKNFRFSASVFPSKDDDVAVSPYNSIFSINELLKCADCVLPFDNQALINIFDKIERPLLKRGSFGSDKLGAEEFTKVKGSKITEIGLQHKGNKKPFDQMNNLIAHVLSTLTCSMRFEGMLNVDLNEITMNLVPHQKMHFLLPSFAPLYSLADKKLQPRSIDQMFKDCLSPDHQLIMSSPGDHMYLAMGLMIRGDVTFSDVNRNIEIMKRKMNTVYWNREGFKYGICNVPSISQKQSVLCLSNNTCIKEVFKDLSARFDKLYSKKVYVHHYSQHIDPAHFDEASQNIKDLCSMYDDYENMTEPDAIPKLKALI